MLQINEIYTNNPETQNHPRAGCFLSKRFQPASSDLQWLEHLAHLPLETDPGKLKTSAVCFSSVWRLRQVSNQVSICACLMGTRFSVWSNISHVNAIPFKRVRVKPGRLETDS